MPIVGLPQFAQPGALSAKLNCLDGRKPWSLFLAKCVGWSFGVDVEPGLEGGAKIAPNWQVCLAFQ